jgi:hypothetical protein
VAPWVHPNTSGVPSVEPRVLVRAAPWERALLVVPVGLLIAALVLPWATSEDRIGANAFAAGALVGTVALVTSRWESQGPFLVGIGTFVVHSVAARHVAEVDEEYGVAIVRADGKRLQLGAMTYRFPPAPSGRRGRRLAAEASAVRRWRAAHAEADLPTGARPWTVDPRWGVFGWMLIAVPVAPAVSFGIAAVF